MNNKVRTERGVALVAAILMMALLSAVGASLVMVAQTETLSSLNYKTMSQARYAAESGVHRAANYLMSAAYPTPTVADLGAYDLAVSPVQFNGAPVVLSSDPGQASNYPDAGVAAAFAAAATGTLPMGESSMTYTARATLVAMRQIDDAYGDARVLQTWEIVGVGRAAGISSAEVEVSAIIERQVRPAFSYAAFATFNGCEALSFAGGAVTDSYDSGEPLGADGFPVLDPDSGGNVGSNGNLDMAGSTTTIGGSMSTPRAGVGKCTSNNVTAQEISGNGTVSEGLIQLPQPIEFPTPDAPDPMPPTTNTSLSAADCAALAPISCTRSGSPATITITPTPSQTVVLGNINLTAGEHLVLNPGYYIINSLDLAGGAELEVGSGGAVVLHIAGQDEARPLDLTGGAVVNSSFNPANLQIVYGGTGELRLRGGAQTAAVVYAPNAETSFAGNADFYGAVITGRLTATGGSAIHYDRALMESDLVTIANFTMNTFTWSTF